RYGKSGGGAMAKNEVSRCRDSGRGFFVGGMRKLVGSYHVRQVDSSHRHAAQMQPPINANSRGSAHVTSYAVATRESHAEFARPKTTIHCGTGCTAGRPWAGNRTCRRRGDCCKGSD